MTKKTKPELVQLFENLLWVNSPKDWILKSTYFQGTLFVSMLIETSEVRHYKKIHRSFGMDVIHSRSEDLWGLAQDCVDEMKTELKQ
jgi:hypothetical protein